MTSTQMVSGGTASGWSVWRLGVRRWQWSAYGPNGGSHGFSTTEEKAIKCARAQYEMLNLPRSTEE